MGDVGGLVCTHSNADVQGWPGGARSPWSGLTEQNGICGSGGGPGTEWTTLQAHRDHVAPYHTVMGEPRGAVW